MSAFEYGWVENNILTQTNSTVNPTPGLIVVLRTHRNIFSIVDPSRVCVSRVIIIHPDSGGSGTSQLVILLVYFPSIPYLIIIITP